MKNFNHLYMTSALILGLSQSVFSQMNPENIWVTFENKSDVPELIDGRLQSSNREVQNLINEFNITNVEQALPDSRQESLLKVYDVECFCDADELASKIIKSSTALTRPEDAPKYELLSLPDDYNVAFVEDYALDLIDAQGAWEYSTGDSNIVLGISDGNFFIDHQELKNKYVNINTTPSSAYYYYHGTAVATTAAGNTNNDIGKSSIGYDCKLNLASMSYSLVLQLSYAGSRVVNISWTSGCTYSSYVQAVMTEVYNNGTIIVAAAGNGGTCGGASNLVYPSACNKVISVSSVGPHDNHQRTIGDPTTTHQHNGTVDICAPGYDVALTVAPGWYLTGNGSSFAAPYVSGTIGLMLSANPCLTFEEIEAILKMTAINLDVLNPTYIGMLGAGRLNARDAVRYAQLTICGGEIGNIGNGTGGTGTGSNGNGGTGIGSGTGTINNDTHVGSTGGHVPNNTDGDDSNGAAQSANLNENGTLIFNANIFPNPTSGSATITWDNNDNMELIVTDLNGSIISQQSVNIDMNQSIIELDQRGLYFVRLVKNGQQLWLKKLVRT